MNDRDAMAWYRGEIERNRDAAERLCEKIHAKHGHCSLGTDCAFHAAFKKCRPFGCELKGIGAVMGVEDIPPPGLCPHGKAQGKEVLCHYPDGDCEHQLIDPDTFYSAVRKITCGREAAVLEFIEQQEQQEKSCENCLRPRLNRENGCTTRCLDRSAWESIPDLTSQQPDLPEQMPEHPAVDVMR